MRNLGSILSWRAAKRLVIAVIGTTVVLLGLVMMLTPGPGLVVILAGLGILATEFVWARRLLMQVKERSKGAIEKARNGFRKPTATPPPEQTQPDAANECEPPPSRVFAEPPGNPARPSDN